MQNIKIVRLDDCFDHYSFKPDGVHLNEDTNNRVAMQMLKSVKFTEMRYFSKNIPVPDVASPTEFPNIQNNKRKIYDDTKKKFGPWKRIKKSNQKLPVVAGAVKDPTAAYPVKDPSVAAAVKVTTVAAVVKDTTVSAVVKDTTVAAVVKDTTVSAVVKDTTVSAVVKDTTVSAISKDTTEAPKDEKVLILAVQHLQRELKDANQLISVLSQTSQNQEPGNILLPLTSYDFLKSNQISVSSLYTTLVAMEAELRLERERNKSLVLKFDSEQTQLLNDLNFLISESKIREETIKTLRLEMEDKHEIIRSSLAVCEGFEKMKGLEEELIKVKVKVAEEQANIVKISNQETLTSTRDPAEQGGSQSEVHSGNSQ